MKRTMIAIMSVAAVTASMLGMSSASAYDYSKTPGTACQPWGGSTGTPYYSSLGLLLNWATSSGSTLKAVCPVDSPDTDNDFTLTANLLAQSGQISCYAAVVNKDGDSYAWTSTKSPTGHSTNCGDGSVNASLTWNMPDLFGPALLVCDLPPASNGVHNGVCSFVVN